METIKIIYKNDTAMYLTVSSWKRTHGRLQYIIHIGKRTFMENIPTNHIKNVKKTNLYIANLSTGKFVKKVKSLSEGYSKIRELIDSKNSNERFEIVDEEHCSVPYSN